MWLLPPAWMNISMRRARARKRNLWLPVIVLWPLLPLVCLIALPLFLVLALIGVFSKRARAWRRGATGLARALAAAHGLEVSARQKNGEMVHIRIW